MNNENTAVETPISDELLASLDMRTAECRKIQSQMEEKMDMNTSRDVVESRGFFNYPPLK